MDQDATWYRGKPRPRQRCVRWGRSSPLKGHRPPVFGSCLPNGCVDEDATWYGSRSQPRPHCVRQGPTSSAKGAQQPPLFSAHVYCGHGRPPHLLLSSCFCYSRKSGPFLQASGTSGFQTRSPPSHLCVASTTIHHALLNYQ